MIHISMTKKLYCDKVKPSRMNTILVDCSTTYPYGVLEDVLVKVDDFPFPTNFMILDKAENVRQ